MKHPPIPENENERIQEIEDYEILHTEAEKDFDNITKLAASICNTKVALITIVGKDTVWHKSTYGTDLKEAPREYSFCAYGINNPNSPFIIENASQDERFFDNPFVANAKNGIQFYTGIPLVPKPKVCIGMLCVIDFEPKKLSPTQIEQLQLLANQVVALLNLHKTKREMIRLNETYKKTNFLFQEAQKLAKLGAWELDLETGETFWTDEVYAIHEVEKDFVHSLQNGIEFYHPDDRDTVIKNVQTTLEINKPSQFEVRFISAKRNFKYVRVTVNSYVEENGKKKLVGCIQDITKEKEAAYIEKLLKSFFDLSPIGIALNDFETGTFIDINNKVIEPTGYTKEEFLALSYWDITPPKYQKQEEEAIQQLIEKGRYGPYQKEYIRKDGTLYPVLLNGILVEDIFGKKRIWSIIEDISEKLEKEKLLKESKTKFETLVTNIPGVVYRYNYGVNWELVYISPYVEKLCGYKVEELLYCQEICFHKIIIHEDLKKLNTIQEALENSGSWEMEYKIKTKNGQIKWVYDKGKVIKNEQKGEIFLDGLMLEITEKVYLMQNLQEAIQLSERASQAKSEFLANMSHEIRTPINGILGFLELLRKTKLDHIQQEYVNTIYNSSQSLLQILNDILDFSKIESGKLELENIHTHLYDLLDQAVLLNSLSAEQKGLDLILDISPDVPLYMYTDPTRLKQIFINLLSNAVKFTNKGEIVFKIRFTPFSERVGNFYFEVSDTGIGITEEQKNKLFQAFSQGDASTTRKFGGTGLGLVISNSIANKMNSQIKLESIYGKGSRFYFSVQTVYELSEFQKLSNLTLIYYEINFKRKAVLLQYFHQWRIKVIEVDSIHILDSVFSENPNVDAILISLDNSQGQLVDFLPKVSQKISKPIFLICSYGISEKLKQSNISNLFYCILNHPVSISRLHANLTQLKKNFTSQKKSTGTKEEKIQKSIFSKILVVEDNPTNLLLVKLFLKEILGNVSIEEARNGLEAIQKTESTKFDLILIDVQMPEMDGMEATKRIRQKENYKNIPVIGITAGVLKEELAHCLKAGMNAVLTKPIHLDSMKKTLLDFSNQTQTAVVKVEPSVSSITLSDESFHKEALLNIVENDLESYFSLLESFLGLKEKFFSLQKFIESKNFLQIQKIAHEIKGAAGNLFFHKISSLTADLEKKAKVENLEVEKIYTELMNEWKLVENFIVQELNSRNQSQQT